MSSSMSEAALKLEIARLSGAINRHKSATKPSFPAGPTRKNTYVNPNYKPMSQSTRPETATTLPLPAQTVRPGPTTSKTREVVIGGVTFQSSGRSLVRKGRASACTFLLGKEGTASPFFVTRTLSAVPKPVPSTSPKPVSSRSTPSNTEFSRSRAGHLVPNGRVYKPKASRGRRGRPVNRNMTLTNSRRPYQSRRSPRKYSDKPCPRFTITGACARGLTCMYQHDPTKIAICWNFLQGHCPNAAETCNLSHDPTPERTPLCMHFANNGRCTRENCPFPHVRVGARQGICRDFAVLGYCEKALDCDKQHVRECPDFADNGSCSTKGCKLPHVIRANRNRKPTTAIIATDGSLGQSVATTSGAPAGTDDNSSLQQVSAEDAQLGDEYISLTFLENESSEDEDDDDDEEDDEEKNDASDEVDYNSNELIGFE